MSGFPKAPFGLEIIEQYLPHRQPMLMLDRVITYDENSIQAEKDLHPDAFYFRGHFDAQPIMPGVMMVECIGQAGALVAALSGNFDGDAHLLAFSSLENAKFRKFVKPNETLCVFCEIVKQRRQLYKFTGRAEVDGELVSKLDFSAILTPKIGQTSNTGE